MSDEKFSLHDEALQKARAGYMDSCAIIDIKLIEIIGRFFLKNYEGDKPLWFQMTHEVRLDAHSSKIILSKILKYRFPEYEESRVVFIQALEHVQKLRNEFAHNAQQTPNEEDLEKHQYRFFDFDEKTGNWKQITHTAEDLKKIILEQTFVLSQLPKIRRMILDRDSEKK